MAVDQLQEALPLHTITATETVNALVRLPGSQLSDKASYASQRLRIQYHNVALASGSGSIQFTTNYSYDNGKTFVAGPSGASITLSSTAQYGEQVLQIAPDTTIAPSGYVYLQILAVISGSPTSPTCAYRADLI